MNEWPIYVFDATPMAIVLVTCIKWYERDISVRNDAVDLESVEAQQLNPRQQQK